MHQLTVKNRPGSISLGHDPLEKLDVWAVSALSIMYALGML